MDLGSTLNHFAHDLGHQRLSLVGSFLHLLVADLNGIVEASQVSDYADAEGLDAAVVRHDDLRNGGHADGVATQCAIHAVLCWCLEGWTGGAKVNAIDQTDALLLGNLCSQVDEFVVIGFVHIREAWTGGEVLAAQRVLREEVDMVGDNHEVANLEGRVHAAGSVGDEEGLDAQLVHHSDGEGHLLHVIAFVVMEASLHSQNVHASEFAED